MQKVIILVGLPASGKSTWANEIFTAETGMWEIISWDCLRHFDAEGNPRSYKFKKKSETEIRDASYEMARKFLSQGRNLIIDNTNLSESSRQHWRFIAEQAGAEVEVKEFNTPLDECVRRNEFRTGWRKVPRPVIERMALMNGRVDWPTDKKVVIVDMDGTLADISWRDPYAHWLIPQDKVRHGVATTVYNLYHNQSSYVCIVSGRQLDPDGEPTIDWLAKHEIPYDRIFMRNRGDNRDDTIVKKEILDKIGPERVSFAIDDRPKVIRMWRENGIKTYDVGDGVEF
jgi:predicted kinase